MCANTSTCHGSTTYFRTMINGHGDDLYNYSQRIEGNFSSNVYNYPDKSKLKSYLQERLDHVFSYPEPVPTSLEKAFSDFFRVEAGNVCVTNGATEAIYLIAQTFREAKSAILMPTFSEYADACRMHAHRVMPFYALEAIPAEARLVWLCNPNNPTGQVYSRDALIRLIEKRPRTIFVIDQSYESFTLQRLFSVKEGVGFPNLVLLHSLTKHYSVPGVRLGYMTANERLLNEIRLRRMPWTVNAMAIATGFYALEQRMALPFDLTGYLREAERLRQALLSTGLIEVWPSDTHFMLSRLRYGKASALKEYLVQEHGLLIRDASNFDGLNDHFFRVATQTPSENDKLTNAINLWITSA